MSLRFQVSELTGSTTDPLPVLFGVSGLVSTPSNTIIGGASSMTFGRRNELFVCSGKCLWRVRLWAD